MERGDIIDAHRFSSNHKGQLSQDRLCGCFYCLSIFSPKEIRFWLQAHGPSDGDGTAVCPYCGVDSVIGASSGYPITPAFLRRMKEHWF